MRHYREHQERACVATMFFFPLLFVPSLVGAIDLLAYTEGRCFGRGMLLGGALPDVCYNFATNNILSVNFADAEFSCNAYIYTGPNCRPETNKGAAQGGRCLTLTGFSTAPSRGESILSARLLCSDSCPAASVADSSDEKKVGQPQSLDANNQTPSAADTNNNYHTEAHDVDVQTAEMVGIAYTEDPSEGTWILKSAGDVKDLFSHFTLVPADDKAMWLLAHGASFEPASEPSD